MRMKEITTKEFFLLSGYIKEAYGINLKEEKKALVKGRLGNMVTQQGFQSFTDFYEYLVKDRTGKASRDLVNRITTNHTYFMREKEHFHFFQQEVLPALIKEAGTPDLRIWSAGCSSGEEPYTLAMLLEDYFKQGKKQWDTKILATDLSENALAKGKEGRYPAASLSPLPESWKSRYFAKVPKDSSRVEITAALKGEVIFRKFNLMEDRFSFKKPFDVIFCRNVMIYFDEETKNKLVQRFYDQLRPGGYLFIGHSETIDRRCSPFQYIKPAVYKKG